MFFRKKIQGIILHLENELDTPNRSELPSDVPNVSAAQEVIQISQNQKDQRELDRKKSELSVAQQRTIVLAQSYEQIANEKVDVLMRETDLFSYLPSEDRRKKIQELVREFLEQYDAQYKKEKERLLSLGLEPQAIEKELISHENISLKEFIEKKQNERREKIREKRILRYIDALLPNDDSEQFESQKAKIRAFTYDFRSIKSQIIEQQPELSDNPDELRKAIGYKIDEQFLTYCESEGISIDRDKFDLDAPTADQNNDEDGNATLTSLSQTRSIMSIQDEYISSAKLLSEASQLYQEEEAKYIKIEDETREEVSYFSLPEKISDLSSGESTSFLSGTSTGGSSTIYEAYREPDGEYTLRFNGHTMKNLPKKEVEVIVDINTIPVINTIFTASSELYRTLLREYTLDCMSDGTDPLQNPPLGFIDFLYSRLNDAYLATNPPNADASLLGKDVSDLPLKERGKYIRNVLASNIGLRAEVIKKLENQKILMNGRINLSRYPR